MAKSVFYDRLESVVLARQYKNKTDFRQAHKALYSYAKRHGWWEEMSLYMKRPAAKIQWTREAVVSEALKYSVKKDFQVKSPGAYAAARKMGIVVEVCVHMKRRLLPRETKAGQDCTRCGSFTTPQMMTPNARICRSCHSKRTSEYAQKNRAWKTHTVALRRARLSRAVPPWIGAQEKREIQAIYKMAKHLTLLTGIEHEVDHIHPIAGRRMCGLHVPANLQVMTKTENRRKSNKDMAA